jgi:uncharacterized protein (TIGR01777 family)
MHILITGGSGFLGKALITQLLTDQHRITVTSRKPEQFPIQHASLTVIPLEQINSINHADVVINLAGAGIADKRWTESRKKLLIDSRLKTTQAVIDWFQQIEHKPQQFLSGSAIGWYGAYDDQTIHESNPAHSGFTHTLCAEWEQCALQAQTLGIPTTLLRTAVVLDEEGGMLKQLKPIYQLCGGGKLGSGQQWLSWISRQDWVDAVRFLLVHPIQGAVNLAAPNPVIQQQFAQEFAQSLHRPAFFTMPEWMVKMAFGEMSHLFLDSQRVLPQKLLDAGFTFSQGSVVQALVRG